MPRTGVKARVKWIAGHTKQSESDFQESLKFQLRSGLRPLWAETNAYYAESLLERGSAADHKKWPNW
jgi:hypothetical protein